MSIPVLPESAPFNPVQRAWLNGFLAGVYGTQDSGAPYAANNAPAASTPAPAAPPVEAEEFPWHEPTLQLQERLELAEGRPLARRLMAAMAQLDCGQCGYLCKSYGEALAIGDDRDVTKCVPGGKDTAKALKKILADSKEAM